MKEEAVLFGESLVGIVTTPSASSNWRSRRAFIFLNAGILHRVGMYRSHVKMARELAKMGFVAFRIDFSGIGDSPARGGNLSVIQRWVAETQAAMDYLTEVKNVEKFVLVGNCSGAAIAFLTAFEDARVHGAVLVNFQGPKKNLRYYVKLALTNPKVWRRLFKGALAARYGVLESLGGVRNRRHENGDFRVIDSALPNLAERQTKLFLIYCSWDPGWVYFNATLKEKLQISILEENLQVEVIPGMDHGFSLTRGQKQLCHAVQKWAVQLQPGRC